MMPDSPMAIPDGWEWSGMGFVRRWIGNGVFSPSDIGSFLGFSGYLWQDLQYPVGAFCSALGLAYFLRGRGLSRLASYGAGLFLGFCGYWLTLFSAGHGTWFRTMAFCVFVFGLADRAVRKNKMKNWALLGACAAWGSFYQTDLWLLFTVFAGVYFLFCCIRERKWPDWKGVVLSAIVFFAIGTPGFIRAITNDLSGRDKQIEESKGTALSGGKEDTRDARWIFVTNWSLPLNESLEFFVPRLNGDTSCPMTLALGRQQGTGVRPYMGALGRPLGAKSGNYRQHSLYVGWVTCLLALLGVVMTFVYWKSDRRRATDDKERTAFGNNRATIIFFGVAAVVFWLFSMGRYCEPVYRLVYALPFGDYLRAPVKWHHLTEMCLCVLAGFGLEYVLSILQFRRFSSCVSAVIVGVIVLFGAFDLARIDRLYCAVVDLSLAQSESPAATEVLRRGGGKVADLLEGGHGFVSWSFSTRRIELTGNPAEPDVRFVWAGARQLTDKNVSAWLKTKGAKPIGAYAVSQKSVRTADWGAANAVLMEIPGAPAKMPPEPETPPVTWITWLGVLSLIATVGVVGYGARNA